GKPQHDDKGFVDSGCSRHMTGNIAYLFDFKQFDGGYVAFGGGNGYHTKDKKKAKNKQKPSTGWKRQSQIVAKGLHLEKLNKLKSGYKEGCSKELQPKRRNKLRTIPTPPLTCAFIFLRATVKFIENPLRVVTFLNKMPPENCLKIIESKSKFRFKSRSKSIVLKVSTSSSTPVVSSDVAELKDMVRALILDKKNQTPAPAPVKAVEQSCVTCGGGHSYQNCPATDGNIYREPISKNFVVYKPPQLNDNQGELPVTDLRWLLTKFDLPGQVYQPQINQPPTFQAPPFQASVSPAPPGVSKPDFDNYVKANDAVMQNMQNQMANITDLITKFVNSNTASTSGSGSLPSNTIANPKGDVKAITTQAGFVFY
ncbi:hypothetical protein Tco_0901780, partial [Tanacetum coccineum]